MKRVFLFVGLFLLWINCSNVVGTPELPPPEELILGTWQVFDVIVDGQNFPVTNPGAGQIQITFEDSTVIYIYPEPDVNGLPTSGTDTLYGDWYFRDNYSDIFITNYSPNDENLVWDIVEIGVGLLHTSYIGRAISDTSSTSTYEFIYRLSN